MSNRLARETSPYLVQHAGNPVDWYPWGPEALQAARREGKPILVSIGYSACHWCHVMAHESFEDQKTADLMNRNFINIKVDREERPDVDSIYMEAVQALTGSGGWPLNVFLTPDARPFFGGTYFPPAPRHGLPSWSQVLEGVAATFAERHDDVLHNATALTDFITRAQRQGTSDDPIDSSVMETAYAALIPRFDVKLGGFAGPPKFPQPLNLELVLRGYQRTADARLLEFLRLTLERMAGGGIFDQLGGGFHRYSVDASWLVPHFEKMLYDNALLARVYAAAYTVTRDERYREVTEATLDFMLRDLRSPDGAFYSAIDADSEGTEGQFYVWTVGEIDASLSSDDARLAKMWYGVTERGNFEGATILTRAGTIAEAAKHAGMSPLQVSERLGRIRDTLHAVRAKRVPPQTDAKILTGWNGLAIRALAEAGRIFDRSDYVDAAERAMTFVLGAMRPNGRLTRSYLGVPSSTPGFLEDYAYSIEALTALYMSTFAGRLLDEAVALADEMVERFWDRSRGAFFDTAVDHGELVVRPSTFMDNPIPSGNSAAAFALLRLDALLDRPDYRDRAVTVFQAARVLLARMPLTVPYLVAALDFHLSSAVQIGIVGPRNSAGTDALIRVVHDRYLPNAVLAVGEPDAMPLLRGREMKEGRPTAYVCRSFVCRVPVTSAAALGEQLDPAAS